MRSSQDVMEAVFVILITVVVAFIFFTWYQNSTKAKEKDTVILKMQEDIKTLQHENLKLQKQLQDLKVLNQKEAIAIYQSLARMNNNFKALGMGYHLTDKDICPDKECRE